MKAYVVTQGSYSDYGIRAVFLDRTEAEAYVADLNRVEPAPYSPPEIEEWEVGRPTGQEEVRESWSARIDVESGTIEEDKPRPAFTRPGQRFNDDAFNRLMAGSYRPNTLVAVSFVSQDHANKLAAERRQAILRKDVK